MFGLKCPSGIFCQNKESCSKDHITGIFCQQKESCSKDHTGALTSVFGRTSGGLFGNESSKFSKSYPVSSLFGANTG
jgi:hypothetical protein